LRVSWLREAVQHAGEQILQGTQIWARVVQAGNRAQAEAAGSAKKIFGVWRNVERLAMRKMLEPGNVPDRDCAGVVLAAVYAGVEILRS